jgi:hypothetical protein
MLVVAAASVLLLTGYATAQNAQQAKMKTCNADATAPQIPALSPGRGVAQSRVESVAAAEESVAFNTETHKYHCLKCKWAIKCTRNCITIPKSEAIKRGGVPCKVCGGSCGSAGPP